ncbi:MAG: PTS sugar transporter subunit IIA [Deltaproteobacteria bacterium]|nr:PTS sugar transporter subunit IIA [Deltaproteobacteria bacterium]
MQITVRDAARLLSTSELQIYEWIDEGRIPVYSVQDEFRFNRAELLHWATAMKRPISIQAFEALEEDRSTVPRLAELFIAGGVHRIGGSPAPRELARVLVSLLPLPSNTDRALVEGSILARAAIGATLVGDQIAIPHVRSPIVLFGAAPAIVIAYAEPPVRLGADDSTIASALCTIVAGSVRAHLHVLARLCAALETSGLRGALKSRAPIETLVQEARSVEVRMERSASRSKPQEDPE